VSVRERDARKEAETEAEESWRYPVAGLVVGGHGYKERQPGVLKKLERAG
jgi:hypothetical protein